jgi:DNA-3-methyladenine glycosylase II
VTGQQLSAQRGRDLSRVAAAIQPFDAARVCAMPDGRLAALGLSAAKIRTLKAVASAIADDGFDVTALARTPDANVIERLTSLHGIGPWTADIYLLFALRRADAFPVGDLALQLAVQRLMKLQERPTPAKLNAIAERWRPWRGAAARLLWADYALERHRPAPAELPGKTRRR